MSFHTSRTFRARIVLSIGVIGLYCIAFILLHAVVGRAVAALAILPVSLIAILFGRRGGFVIGLLLIPLHIGLFLALGDTYVPAFARNNFGAAHVIFLFIGMIIGYFQDLKNQLQRTLAEVKALRGMLPICACCKNIRNDQGYWEQLEHYIETHSDVSFTHSICPICVRKLYPDLEHDEHSDLSLPERASGEIP